jgi:predicted Zn-dependent protease
MPLMGLPDLTQENTHAIDAALSGKPSVACNHYAHLLQIHPDHPGLIQNYALSLLLNQQPKEAQQWINRLSADHPLQSIKNLV